MFTTNDIRAAFLNFFSQHDHQVVPSSSLVPSNDPTLLFTNAGMVQFKNVFTGQEKRPYKRATTAQKVVRAGGKHNDLDNVGYTARHHTFFEMLGNFSFGDYFKEGAIEYAWKLITQTFSLPKDRLLITVYSEDQEAAQLWKKITGFPDSRIIPIATADNFWRMGDTGPCGPCSEIFYDHGPDVPGGPPGSTDEDGDRFVEIWNLVFMQFFEDPPGSRNPLPRPSIDTGLGLERFAAIMQGKRDNYDIDTLRNLILASADVTHHSADGQFKVSHRVIADHLRSTAFLIADGVLPSKEGRGYVLRRIMRRAMRHLHMMGVKDPTFYKLVPALIKEMGMAYPELIRAEPLIIQTMKGEEERFTAMLERGMSLLSEEVEKLPQGAALPGDIAFKLYDTYGFPLDLTADALRERGHNVDVAGFEAQMQDQRQRARAAWAGSGDTATESVWFEPKEKFGATEFLGYHTQQGDAEIQAIVVDNQLTDKASIGQHVAILLNQTPFYGESGGQVGDSGFLTAPGVRISVNNTLKKLGNLIVHIGYIEEGTITVGTPLHAEVDEARHKAIRAHHSSTHLLHEALRQHLGTHVTQKGSLNTESRLRFDISHPNPISPEELRLIEDMVNERIRENTEVVTRIMTPDQAIAEGAMALFGEKYGDEVRVVSMGGAPEQSNRLAWSIELCGGTHVKRTGDIGHFRILSESGVSAGVRRIEAVSGLAAEKYAQEIENHLAGLSAILKTPLHDMPQRLETLLKESREKDRKIAALQKELALGGSGQEQAANQEIEQINSVAFLVKNLGDIPPKELKSMADTFRKKAHSGIIALTSTSGNKVSIVVSVSPDLIEKYNAVDLVKIASTAMGSQSGGGRPDMAQAGGSDVSKIPLAFEALRKALSSQ
ncbi:alanine--tRNA ligase [Entomobacter blattae]|uniref:Alanine--tRNA ligase n=1 Tax=Entomobacter blattae TaxID=2762277 RepID=A0A7H1NUV5_9PROT|nr:alanine--tRNA ligase [Entomobacter blattae]QNT79565.1 Alanine--tRNA ligase [Entomobacter blattae]